MKVSVSMITYNHEPYIAQAIDSVLMQQANFPYELVIGEDDSTDNTRAIVKEYKKRYPDKIRLLLNDRKNVIYIDGKPTGRWNFINTLNHARGEYIALLDGDDYWTSPHKLQKQVDFLGSHPECAICFHNVRVVYEDGTREPHDYCPAEQKEISTLEDLLLSDFIPTCSTMFRRGLFHELPDWYYSLPMGDWPLHIFNAQHGNIGYIDEVMGVYRVHSGGVYSGQDVAKRVQADIQVADYISAYLGLKYEHIIGAMVADRWGSVAAVLAEQRAQQGSVEAAIGQVMDLFSQWSTETSFSHVWKAHSLSKIYAGLFFASYKAHDIPTTRYCLVKTIRHNPSWLHNWGVWSIAAEAFLGQLVACCLRQVARCVVPGLKKLVNDLQQV